MNSESATKLVAPFYEALNQPSKKDVDALLGSCLAPTWTSSAIEGDAKGREAFIQQVKGFGKALPDLKWTIREVVADGDKIVVRSEVTGTPAGDFMGVPHAGKSFKIMTLDLHTVRDDKMAHAFHCEDWASALRQLK